MAIGPGKYDAECTYVRDQADAARAAVIVIGGKLGHGFSVQGEGDAFQELAMLPGLLRKMANDIEASYAKT
jgi:hypothetical protein